MVEYLKVARVCLVVLVCTTTVELVVLVTIAVHWRFKRNELMAPKEQQLCFSRDKFSDRKGNESCIEGLKEVFSEKLNVTTCCGDASLALENLVAKVASERYNSSINPEIASLNLTEFSCYATKGKRPVAKLEGLSTDKTPVQSGTSSKIIWNTDATSYMMSRQKYIQENGSIYVEQPGHYYVFSQIKLKLGNNDALDKNKGNVFRHFIHLISNKGTVTTLLENVQSLCDQVSKESEATSTIGAVFKLEKGDQLYVATSHPERLASDRHSNYFSVHSV